MPVNSQHESYQANAGKWTRARDVLGGEDAIHAKGTDYLPKLSQQEDADYKAMLMRSPFFNASGRTLDALVGMVFRKPPIIDASEGFRPVINDVDLKGTSTDNMAMSIMREVLSVSKCGVLVEYPRVQNAENMTQAQVEAMNLRPYGALYKTEAIINWKYSRIANVMQLTMVVLAESYVKSDDGYATKTGEQYRELSLENGIYTQKVWRKKEKSQKEWELIEVITPLQNNQPLSFIPFYEFSENNSLDVGEALLDDLFSLNLAHYRVSADYENGCHFTGLPMLMLAGVELKENENIYVGSQKAVVTDNAQAHGEFIEFHGQGLGALEKNLERKEAQMASIGARMLAPEKMGVESADALSIKHSGEDSVLASVANSISQQLSKMLTFMASWANLSQTVTVKLNTDFVPLSMTPQKLGELTKALQSGAISFETYFYNLQQGEIIQQGRTIEQELEAINDDNTLDSDNDNSNGI